MRSHLIENVRYVRYIRMMNYEFNYERENTHTHAHGGDGVRVYDVLCGMMFEMYAITRMRNL